MFSGRIDRLGFLLGNVYLILPIIVIILAYACVSLFFGDSLRGNQVVYSIMNIVLYLFGLLWIVGFIPVTYSLYIRRLHDMNKSGLFSLLYFVPVGGALFPLILLFFRGTDGPNDYGQPYSPRNFDRVMFGAHRDELAALQSVQTPQTPPVVAQPTDNLNQK